MFSSILLASDGSECARRAAAVAAAFANKFGAHLTIINVYHPATLFAPYGKPHDLFEFGFIEKQQDEALGAVCRIADGSDVAYQARRENGQPAEEIVRVAAEETCDLIVMGSRGLGDVGSLLLGSISEGVLHHAHCPVLIVREAGGTAAEKEAADEDTFSNILLASDGSECALKAAEFAAALVGKFASRLTIINVFHPPLYIAPDGVPGGWEPDVSDIGDDQDAAVCSAGRVVDEQNVPYRRCKETGIPAAEIVRVAEEEGCDLIVLGSRGLSGMKAFLLGSVSDGVAHHAHCPVLIVK